MTSEQVLIGCEGCKKATRHGFAGTYFVGEHSGWRHLWRCLTCATTRVYGATRGKPLDAQEFALSQQFGESQMCDSDMRLITVHRRDLGLPSILLLEEEE